MHLGLGRLRLSPDAFWAMTPREFNAVLGPALVRRRPPSRADLARLMRAHPDSEQEEHSLG